MITRVVRLLWWRTLAIACLVVGIVGVILPGIPGVPFLLVAAWASGRGWPWLEAWLIAHPRYGPPIRQWRDHRAVPRRVKWFASVTMTVSAALLWLSPAPVAAKIGVPLVSLAIGFWLWLRPER